MDPAEAKELAIIASQAAMNEATARGNSDIQQFYNDAVVFVTGASGFLGKQLVEKLFRACNIRKMYLLMRCKKGKSIQRRLTEMLEDPVFQVVRDRKPEFQDRIQAIEGDVSLLNLGLSDEDRETITKEVSVIFHGAATVKFDEALKIATLTNVRGTREVLRLGKDCVHLRSFVYISTAYSHALASRVGGEVLEQFYETSPPEAVIRLAERGQLDEATKLMEGWPNTYSFTKALAEDLVRAAGPGMPVCVVRPAIVVGTYQEPMPGWVEPGNVFGASGLALGFTMGFIHVVFAKPDVKISFVPADLVNNAVIAAGWDAGQRRRDGARETVIYTVTSARNYITWGDCVRILCNEVSDLVSPKAMWYSYLFLAGNTVTYTLLRFFLHLVPALVVDITRVVMGKRPKLLPLYKKVHNLTSVLKYFLINDWQFSDKNLLQLYNNMSKDDKIIFNCDVCTICTTETIVRWSLGLRKYIVKDGLKGTERALKRQKVFKYLSIIIVFAYILFIWFLVKFFLMFIGM